ncbi:hypothetical protein [Thiocapsa bogorovii]|uniref:hypothetical protein n=1 Tax=Thiocapsa bogorovii TaxID=521689 RepID=UPI001E346F2D|nr:hypothetical protein [Thiocapsa bogorovii]UHD17931.1 hypothetical protein LT988_07795 [Thiocapsa bogorovii]
MRTQLVKNAIVAIVVATSFACGNSALAAGGKNAYNNPTGDPAEDTYQTPYTNVGEGRIMVFCAEGETLVVTPAEDGAVEAVCVPAAA